MTRVCATATLLLAIAFSGGGTAWAQPIAKEIVLTLDDRKTYQTIEHFGASDAWSCQFVGQWPASKKEQMADWLFSSDTMADGTPKGIALSLWRFNLGAGSAQQGDSSGIKDEWRRAESLLTAEGEADLSKQAGQQWFLKAAKQRGVPFFLAFLNSPPVTITSNRKAFADKGQSNLAAGNYRNLAAYIAESISGLQRQNNIRFNYVSPVNEPQWDWSDGGQEGNPYTNEQLSGVVRVLDAALVQAHLPVKISVTEAGHLKYLLEDGDKPGRGNQVTDLMKPGGPHYIGDLPTVDKAIAGHSYFSTSPFSEGIGLRKRLADRIASVKGTAYWQSEYCILGDNGGEISGQKRDTGMTAALYLAKVMYADLVAANATSWQWWLAISPYDYKDGLIYIDKNKTDGAYTDSKLLWALGNYSRFVRPGMRRIGATLNTTDSSCLASAFTDPATGKIVMVLVNSSGVSRHVEIKKYNGRGWKSVEVYTTSHSKKLQHQSGRGRMILEPQSVTTLVVSPNK